MMNTTLTKKLSALALFGAVAFGDNAHAQIIWGAGSADPVADTIGRFAADFNTPNGWTPESVMDNNGTPGLALWTKTMNGITQGAFAGTTPIGSASQADGVALFDSDFMDNGGDDQNLGGGVAPAPHKGHLTSPAFDLTGFTDVPIKATMRLEYRNFQIDELSIGFSSDNGATWDDFDIQQGLALNAPPFRNNIEVTLTNVTAGVTDLTQCKLRFTFDGNYYYAMVDDVALEYGDPYNIAFTLPSAAYDYRVVGQPAPFRQLPTYVAGAYGPQIAAAMVTNKGGVTIPLLVNPRIAYEVSRNDGGNWTSLLIDTVALPPVPPGDTVSMLEDITVGMQDAYASHTGAAEYRIVYTLMHDDTDSDMSDNSMELYWNTTYDRYSACDLDPAGGPVADDYAFPGAGTGNVVQEFEWGGLYYFPDTTGLALDSVEYRMYLSSTFNLVAFPTLDVTVNVYEFDASAADLATAMQLRTLSVDNIPTAGLPGTYVSRKVKIVDPNNLNPQTFDFDYPYGLWQSATEDPIYAVTLSQVNSLGLTDGTIRRGFWAATQELPYKWNDEVVLETLTPMRVVEGPSGGSGSESWYSGFTGPHVAPSISVKTTVWPIVGVNEVETNKETANQMVSVFPNPASTITNVSVNLDKVSSMVRYIVTDAQGRVLRLDTRQNLQNDVYTMDVTNLPAGVYFIHVKTDSGKFTKQIVKQ